MISCVWGKLPMGLTALLSMAAFILTGCLKPAAAVGLRQRQRHYDHGYVLLFCPE